MKEPDSNVTPCKQHEKDHNPHEWNLPFHPAFANFPLVLTAIPHNHYSLFSCTLDLAEFTPDFFNYPTHCFTNPPTWDSTLQTSVISPHALEWDLNAHVTQ